MPSGTSARASRTFGRKSIVLLVTGAFLLTACGTEEGNARAGTTADRPDTSSTTVSPAATSTDTEPSFPVLAADLEPCRPDELQYTTLPDWTAVGLSSALTLRSASTEILEAGPATPTRFSLISRDGDRVKDSFELEIGSDWADITSNSYASPEPGTAELTTVRGHPGKVARVAVSRSTSSTTIAAWEEDGLKWSAMSGSLGVNDLADALASLDLTPDRVSDPSGRFEVVGSAPRYQPKENRVTALEIMQGLGNDRQGNDGKENVGKGNVLRYYVRIDQATPGTTGMADWVSEGAKLTTVDGRLLTILGNHFTSTTDDGSLVSIDVYQEAIDPDGTSSGANPTEPDPKDVAAIISAIRRRDRKVAAKDWPVPLVVGQVESGGRFCLED